MSNKKIIISFQDNYFIFPEPKELLKNIGSIDVHQITYKNGTPDVAFIEIKQFFMYNSHIFQLYLQEIVNRNILPSNFYMFVDQILYIIKVQNLEVLVDNYWQNLLKN